MEAPELKKDIQTSPHLIIKELQSCDTKVRPKRKYIKKKDRLKGVMIKEGLVIVRFD